jgi:hypothetical protein
LAVDLALGMSGEGVRVVSLSFFFSLSFSMFVSLSLFLTHNFLYFFLKHFIFKSCTHLHGLLAHSCCLFCFYQK